MVGHAPVPFLQVATLGHVVLVHLAVAAIGFSLLRPSLAVTEATTWSASPGLPHA